jgi:hypothetical protein
LVCFVHLLDLVQPNRPDKPNEQAQLENFLSLLQGFELRGMMDQWPGWIEMDRQAISKTAMQGTRRYWVGGISGLRWIRWTERNVMMNDKF